ncbi:hypothetical protein L218DRAFT_866855, partial [Marasmius fiardii PR-910]
TAPGPSSRTLAEYFQLMKGKCTGCGINTHCKEACDQKDTVCDYCKGKGHFAQVCIDRFLGQLAGGHVQARQHVAASTGTPFTLFPEDESAPTAMDF